jgi:hypothetical protein
MIIKFYLEAFDDRLTLQVLYLDRRFKYSDGVMRRFIAGNGIEILSANGTFIDDSAEHLVVGLGYADEEAYIFKNKKIELSYYSIKEDILTALYELVKESPHFKDLLGREEKNIYEF